MLYQVIVHSLDYYNNTEAFYWSEQLIFNWYQCKKSFCMNYFSFKIPRLSETERKIWMMIGYGILDAKNSTSS